jgi:hypothetical protein
VRSEGLCQGKIAIDSIYNCTPDFLACNAVPQPTVPLHAYRLEKIVYVQKGGISVSALLHFVDCLYLYDTFMGFIVRAVIFL